MAEKMDIDQFKSEVFNLLKNKYSSYHDDNYLTEAIEEYDDIIRDGYGHRYGQAYGAEYAARNISMCI